MSRGSCRDLIIQAGNTIAPLGPESRIEVSGEFHNPLAPRAV